MLLEMWKVDFQDYNPAPIEEQPEIAAGIVYENGDDLERAANLPGKNASALYDDRPVGGG